MGKMSLRGEILVGALIVISIWLFYLPASPVTLLLISMIYCTMMLTTKTSLMFIESSLSLFLALMLFNQVQYGYHFILTIVCFFIVRSHYKRRGIEFTLPTFRMCQAQKSETIHRSRYPYVTKEYILTEEEKPPSIKEVFYLIPFLPLSLVSAFFLPNTLLFFVVRLMTLFHLVGLYNGRRYLVHLAFFSAMLLVGIADLHPYVLVPSFVLNIIFLIVIGKNKQNNDVYIGVNWLKENVAPDSLIIAWWKYGHILSGYGGFRNIWDSYFINVDIFLKCERLFDNIVERTVDGICFCNQNNAQYLLVETFRSECISNEYELCYQNKSIHIYRLF